MGRQRRPENDYAEKLMECGPFGGIDPTTETYYVNKTNFIDMLNIIPNVGYGGYVTCPGRQVFSQIPTLPHPIVKISKFSTFAVEYGYIVICNNAGNAVFYYCTNNTATLLPLPVGAQFRVNYVLDNVTYTAKMSTCTYNQWLFVTNGVDTPLKIDTNFVVSYWGIVAPTTAPTLIAGASGNLNGTYRYTITYEVTSTGQESGQGFNTSTKQSVYSAPITVTNQQINLTAIPVSTDPQVTARNIYRIGGANGTWSFVATIPDNTTTTYTDNIPDDQLGQVLVVFRDPPLPFIAIAVYQNCVFGFGTHDNPSMVYFSNFDEPWGFYISNQALPVGDNSHTDPAIGMASTGSIMGLVTRSSFYGVYGNSATTFNVQFVADIGGVNIDAVISAYGYIWYLSRQGFYVWGGSGSPSNISDGQFQKSNIKKILDNMADADKVQAVCWQFDKMLGISFPSLNTSYIYDQRSQAWYPIGWATDQACSDPNGVYPLIGQNLEANGQVDLWFAGGGDLGEMITAYILSGITNSGTVGSLKLYRYAIVECQPQNADLGVLVIADTGLNQKPYNFKVPVDSSGPLIQFSLPDGFKGHTIQMKVSIITDQIIHIQSASVHGWVERMYNPMDALPSNA